MPKSQEFAAGSKFPSSDRRRDRDRIERSIEEPEAFPERHHMRVKYPSHVRADILSPVGAGASQSCGSPPDGHHAGWACRSYARQASAYRRFSSTARSAVRHDPGHRATAQLLPAGRTGTDPVRADSWPADDCARLVSTGRARSGRGSPPIDVAKRSRSLRRASHGRGSARAGESPITETQRVSRHRHSGAYQRQPMVCIIAIEVHFQRSRDKQERDALQPAGV